MYEKRKNFFPKEILMSKLFMKKLYTRRSQECGETL
jgi:hypothetical protein